MLCLSSPYLAKGEQPDFKHGEKQAQILFHKNSVVTVMVMTLLYHKYVVTSRDLMLNCQQFLIFNSYSSAVRG